MTPAIDIARKRNIEHRVRDYGHDPASESYGAEAAEKLGVLPVSSMSSLKRIAAALGAKKAAMADRAGAERATG